MKTATFVLSAAVAMIVAGNVGAEEAASSPAPALSLELNGAQPSEKGCRLTFVVNNGLGASLSKAAFEIALFNDAGVVDRLTVLDFRICRKARPRSPASTCRGWTAPSSAACWSTARPNARAKASSLPPASGS